MSLLEKKITPLPAWKEFSRQWSVGEVHVGDSIDPADKRAYAWAPISPPAGPAWGKEVQLPAGEQRVYKVALAVADSPLAAYGILASLKAQTGEMVGTLRDSGGAAISQASLLVRVQDTDLPAYPDAAGKMSFGLPPGDYQSKVVDIGREETGKSFSVAGNKTTQFEIVVPAASAIQFDISDQFGQPSPCKVQFIGREWDPYTESRNRLSCSWLRPSVSVPYWQSHRRSLQESTCAHIARNTISSNRRWRCQKAKPSPSEAA
jgi:hypothetical protein